MLTRPTVLAVLLATALPSTPAFAQSAPSASDERDQIIVTGTRRADRVLADSPVPVDVLSAESLSRTGLTETARALRDLLAQHPKLFARAGNPVILQHDPDAGGLVARPLTAEAVTALAHE
ncbi:MAG: hypothetical protein ACK4TG_11580, partial [Thermaurantiacus sp.]